VDKSLQSVDERCVIVENGPPREFFERGAAQSVPLRAVTAEIFSPRAAGDIISVSTRT
jgi:hypothetical protein